MKFRQVNVDEETFDKIEKLSKLSGTKKYLFIKGLVLLFEKNRPLINADFFQKSSEEHQYKIEAHLEKIIAQEMKKETNRLIGFIRTQDKYLSDMKRDLMFKIDPDRSGEYHPLFAYFDFVLKYFELYLETKNSSMEDVYNMIKEKISHEQAELFWRSLTNVQSKTMEY